MGSEMCIRDRVSTERFQLARPALVLLSDVIAVHYAIGTMLTIAQFERPVRGTLARVATFSVA